MLTNQRTQMQQELSNWLDEDVMAFIHREHDRGKTYRQIASELSKSGYNISHATVQSWVSYARSRSRRS